MAERSNATSKKKQDAAQDVSTLQKRGRRRLVGAIALVLLAVIILPMVLDPEPRPNTPAVSIRIPNEEGSKFTPKASPKQAAQPEPVAEAPKAPASPAAEPVAKAEPKVEPKPEPKPEPKAEPKPAEKKTAPVAPTPEGKAAAPAAAPKPVEKAPSKPPEQPAPKVETAATPPAPASATGEKFVVQVGAFASADKVREITDQLKQAKLAHYVESVPTANGPVTRIRLGPYDSKEAAAKARDRAKGLGLAPANPIAK